MNVSEPIASLTMASLVCFAAEHLLRTDPEDGLEGFFIALFVRKAGPTSEEPSEDVTVEVRTKQVRGRRNGVRAFSSLRLSRMILW